LAKKFELAAEEEGNDATGQRRRMEGRKGEVSVSKTERVEA
jgi:hypothetical protein